MAGPLLELLGSGNGKISSWTSVSALIDSSARCCFSEKKQLFPYYIIIVEEGPQVRSPSGWTAAFWCWRGAAEFFPHKRSCLPACLPLDSTAPLTSRPDPRFHSDGLSLEVLLLLLQHRRHRRRR